MASPDLIRRCWRALGAAGVVALCVSSLMPPPSLLSEGFPYSDKLYHLTAYLVLMWWLAMGAGPRAWRVFALALAALGALLEVLQGFTPLREASAWDELANVSGVLCGYWFARRTPPGFPAFRRAK